MTENVLYNYYCSLLPKVPDWLKKYLDVPCLNRLKHVGYFCGMDYASKDIYDFNEKITRFDHSLSTALITLKFTDKWEAVLAALFHDVATPCFSHVIDYMNKELHKPEAKAKIQKMVNTLRKKNYIRAERASNFRDYSKQLNNQIALCIAVRNRMKSYVYDKEQNLILPEKIYQSIKTGDIATSQNVINELRSAVNKLENNRAQGTNTGHFLSRSYDDEKDKGGMER